jgi:hypothetical protein
MRRNRATQVSRAALGRSGRRMEDDEMSDADDIEPEGQSTSPPGITDNPHPEAEKPSANPTIADQFAGSETSERKKEANRENAKYSAGPKTERGKRAVRDNALKHGFYATDAVIGHADGWEDTEEFNLLHDALKRDLNPEGALEESLVHSITVAEWRLRRALRAEVGEIRLTADSFYSCRFFDQVEQFGLASGGLRPQAKSKEGARQTAAVIEGQLMILSSIRAEVERLGYVTETSQQALDTSFGTQATGFATKCYELSSQVRRRQSPEGRDSDPERARLMELLHPNGVEEASAEEVKQALLRQIDIKIMTLRELHNRIETLEKAQATATLMANNLPSREFVDKLIRYESGLDRKKEKNIKLLLELQARRRGGKT